MKDGIDIPPPVRPFVEALGEAGAVDFLLRFGGGMLYLSPNPRAESMAARAIGVAKVRELAARIDQGMVRVPTAKPFIAAHLRERGLSVQAIARKLHMSDVAVRGWLRGGDARQSTFKFR